MPRVQKPNANDHSLSKQDVRKSDELEKIEDDLIRYLQWSIGPIGPDGAPVPDGDDAKGGRRFARPKSPRDIAFILEKLQKGLTMRETRIMRRPKHFNAEEQTPEEACALAARFLATLEDAQFVVVLQEASRLRGKPLPTP